MPSARGTPVRAGAFRPGVACTLGARPTVPVIVSDGHERETLAERLPIRWIRRHLRVVIGSRARTTVEGRGPARRNSGLGTRRGAGQAVPLPEELGDLAEDHPAGTERVAQSVGCLDVTPH